MEMTHITPFTDAMKRKDLEEMLTHMADDVVLNTPLASEPVKGKAAIRQVVGALLKVVDKFDVLEFMQGPEHVSSFSKSLPAQSNWTEWTIGVSIRRV